MGCNSTSVFNQLFFPGKDTKVKVVKTFSQNESSSGPQPKLTLLVICPKDIETEHEGNTLVGVLPEKEITGLFFFFFVLNKKLAFQGLAY